MVVSSLLLCYTIRSWTFSFSSKLQLSLGNKFEYLDWIDLFLHCIWYPHIFVGALVMLLAGLHFASWNISRPSTNMPGPGTSHWPGNICHCWHVARSWHVKKSICPCSSMRCLWLLTWSCGAGAYGECTLFGSSW